MFSWFLILSIVLMSWVRSLIGVNIALSLCSFIILVILSEVLRYALQGDNPNKQMLNIATIYLMWAVTMVFMFLAISWLDAIFVFISIHVVLILHGFSTRNNEGKSDEPD